MNCSNCSSTLEEGAKFCKYCGTAQEINTQTKSPDQDNGLVGFSSRINDPAFARYLKDSNHWSLIFASILAVIAVVGFFIYGQTSSEMDNPQALYIGLGIGGMFLLIAFGQIIGRKRGKDWDGTVEDKTDETLRRKRKIGENRYHWEEYTAYTVYIRSDADGQTYMLQDEGDDTRYNYYEIGDRVRYHGTLHTFEKYDKSQDTIIFCNACGSLNDIEDDYCFRCKCPLLK